MKTTLLKDLFMFYGRDPKCPTTPNDRKVLKLHYRSATAEVEMGLVCETAEGKYWCFTTNPGIYSMPPKLYLVRHDTLQSAGDALLNYVAEEVFRIMCLESDMPFQIMRTFKKRDRKAFEKYVSAGAAEGEEEAFKCGIDWMMRSEGTLRRPVWAKYMAQNRDGQRIWFENKPTLNRSAGIWEAEGRSSPAAVEEWANSLVKLD